MDCGDRGVNNPSDLLSSAPLSSSSGDNLVEIILLFAFLLDQAGYNIHGFRSFEAGIQGHQLKCCEL